MEVSKACTAFARLLFVGTLSLSGCLSGCKASGDASATARGGASGDAATPPGPPPTCRPGEIGNPDPAFCYRLPPSMKQKGDPLEKKGRYQLIFEGEAGAKISFVVWGPDAFDATWRALKNNAGRSRATDAKEQELDGGKTALLTYTTPGEGGRAIISYVTRGKIHTLECEAETPKGGKPGQEEELLAACKALHDP